MQTALTWDIFCAVIDNHGDLGVCWRLSKQLASAGQRVRLWVDDAAALAWMAEPGETGYTGDTGDTEDTGDSAHSAQGIRVLPWADASRDDVLASLPTADVWIEAFGCTLPVQFVAQGVASRSACGKGQPMWLNLEYLSAEHWVARQHGLPSPQMSGPAKGWVKHFFYPGFTPETGGLLREHDLLAQQHRFAASGQRDAWRQAQTQGAAGAAQATRQGFIQLGTHANAAVSPQGEAGLGQNGLGWLISLFCYESTALPQLLSQLAGTQHHLLVTPGRPLAAVQQALPGLSSAALQWRALPYTPQRGFDAMLWACDLNMVRGEDSLVRALWAGQPLVWHIYPQDDHAHHAKLHAFLDWLQAPPSLRQFHLVWNEMAPGPLPLLNAHCLSDWYLCIQAARARLLHQTDLATQLLRWVNADSGAPVTGSSTQGVRGLF